MCIRLACLNFAPFYGPDYYTDSAIVPEHERVEQMDIFLLVFLDDRVASCISSNVKFEF